MALFLLLFLLHVCESGSVHVAVFSDVHLNLGPEMSCLGEHVVDNNFDVAQLWCDSPLSLITSSLQQLASQDSCPAAFVVPGDVLRHARPLSPDRALQTYTSFLSAVSSAFAPGCAAAAVPVISLGNNDFLQPYSGVGTLSPWLLQLVDVLPSTKNLSAVDRAVFVQTGCYTMDVFALNVRFVILNTNFWSAQNSNTQGTDKDPGGLIEWMQKQLQKAKSQGRKVTKKKTQKEGFFFEHLKQVWLLGHAPPGVDHYSKKDAWHAVIANNFYSVLSPFLSEGIVTQSFFGHEHFILERKIVPDRDDMSLLSGSVSPDKGNYPSVRLLDVDVATAKVVDLKNWYLPLGTTLTPLWSLVEQGSFIAQFRRVFFVSVFCSQFSSFFVFQDLDR
jgi:hypothetical protein